MVFHSVAVGIVVNGVLRTLWIISRRVRPWMCGFMGIPKWIACIPLRALPRGIDDHFLSRASAGDIGWH